MDAGTGIAMWSRMLRSFVASLLLASLAAPALADDVTDATAGKTPALPRQESRDAQLHEKKRAYLQAKLEAARDSERDTRIEGAALIASSVAIPVVTIGGALAAFAIGGAVEQPEAGMVAGVAILGAGSTLCWLSPYALLTGLTRFSDAEEVEREVSAREQLLVAHQARAVRF